MTSWVKRGYWLGSVGNWEVRRYLEKEEAKSERESVVGSNGVRGREGGWEME